MDATAVATAALAVVTVVLVWATLRLGGRAEEEQRAQWRPVLAVRERREFSPFNRTFTRTTETGLAADHDRLEVLVDNVGRGPALDATATGASGSLSPERASIVEAGQSVVFTIDLRPEERTSANGTLSGSVGFSLQYADISGASCRTVVLVSPDVNDTPRVIVQTFTFLSPLSLSWARLVPRRWRPRLWPLTKRLIARQGYRVP